jgi:hypothetical protein
MSYFGGPVKPGVLRLREKVKNPFGYVRDVDGVKWHLNGQIGECVLACKYDEVHPHYTSTCGDYSTAQWGDSLITQTWKPYKVEVVE